jgi:hypothetical protein
LALALITWAETGEQATVSPEERFLLGPATISLALAATVIVLIAMVDFLVWLGRAPLSSKIKLALAGFVIASFSVCVWIAWDAEIVWLVEGDVEVRFARDSYLPVVFGAVGGGIACLLSWLLGRSIARSEANRSS